MKKTTPTYITILFVLLQHTLYAQSNRVMSIPLKYLQPKEGINYLPSNKIIAGKPWEVFTVNKSTRSDYKKYSFSLSPNKKYYVVEETKKKLHIIKVAKEETSGVYKKDLSSVNHNDVGWVDKKDILLWKHCLVDQNRNPIKAFVKKNKHHIKSLEPFMYVYKYEEDSIILGVRKNYNLDDLKTDDPFFLKVKRENTILWRNNFSLDLNISELAIRDRQKENQPLVLFLSENSAINYALNKKIAKDIYFIESFINPKILSDSIKLMLPIIESINSICKSVIQTNSNSGYSYQEVFFHNVKENNMLIKNKLFSRVELTGLINKLESLLDTRNSNNPRESLFDEYKVIWEIEMHNTSFDESILFQNINFKLFGYHSDNILNQYKIRSIKDENTISFLLLKTYYIGLGLYIENLKEIINNDSPSFYSGEVPYYWVLNTQLW